MWSFPPKQWTVRYLRDMDQLGCTSRSDSGIYMDMFLAVKPVKGEEGTFRYTLASAEKVKLRFNIEAVLPSGLFAGMTAEAEVVVADHVKLMKNSVCSEWMSITELVQSQDMTILDGNGEDVAEEFLAGMASYRQDVLQESGSMDKAGICFRWLIGNKKGEMDMLLMAQVIIS